MCTEAWYHQPNFGERISIRSEQLRDGGMIIKRNLFENQTEIVVVRTELANVARDLKEKVSKLKLWTICNKKAAHSSCLLF